MYTVHFAVYFSLFIYFYSCIWCLYISFGQFSFRLFTHHTIETIDASLFVFNFALLFEMKDDDDDDCYYLYYYTSFSNMSTTFWLSSFHITQKINGPMRLWSVTVCHAICINWFRLELMNLDFSRSVRSIEMSNRGHKYVFGSKSYSVILCEFIEESNRHKLVKVCVWNGYFTWIYMYIYIYHRDGISRTMVMHWHWKRDWVFIDLPNSATVLSFITWLCALSWLQACTDHYNEHSQINQLTGFSHHQMTIWQQKVARIFLFFIISTDILWLL